MSKIIIGAEILYGKENSITFPSGTEGRLRDSGDYMDIPVVESERNETIKESKPAEISR